VNLQEIVWICVVVAGASATQAISGFGFALIAVPLLSLFVDPQMSVVLATVVGAFSSTFQAITDRRYAQKKLVQRLAVTAYMGMPFGLVVFLVVSESVLRFIVGVVVLIAAVALMRGFYISHTNKKIDWIMGWASGVLATSTSTNGPPLVFLLQAKKLSPESFRASINVVFSLTSFGAILLFAVSGNITTEDFGGIAVSVPMLLLGLAIGFKVRSRINAEQFRVLVFVLLVVSALSALLAAVVA
jgi:uncharacterized membrane protein YfcA